MIFIADCTMVTALLYYLWSLYTERK